MNTKQNKRQITVKVLNLVGYPLMTLLILWAVVGTILTWVAVFVGSVVTYGLAGWPIGLLGFGVSIGVPYLVFLAYARAGDKACQWAKDGDRDPKAEAERQARKAAHLRLLRGEGAK